MTGEVVFENGRVWGSVPGRGAPSAIPFEVVQKLTTDGGVEWADVLIGDPASACIRINPVALEVIYRLFDAVYLGWSHKDDAPMFPNWAVVPLGPPPGVKWAFCLFDGLVLFDTYERVRQHSPPQPHDGNNRVRPWKPAAPGRRRER